MTSIAEAWLDRGRLALLALIPLLSAPWLAEHRELPRIALAEWAGFGGLAVAVAAGRWWVDGAWARRAAWVAAAWLAASVAAVSPWRSIFGPYEGHAGALALLGYLALAAVPASPEARPTWARVLVASGVVQAVWALAQWRRGEQPIGSLGHIVFLAGFCMLAGSMAAALAARAPRPITRLLWSAAFAACLAAVLATTRRGPLLGLGAGALVAVATIPRETRRWRGVAAVALASTLVAVPVLLRPPPGMDNVFTRFHQSLAGLGPAKWDTARRRLALYRVGAEAFGRHPLLGSGFGSFRDQAAHTAPTESEVETSVHDFPLELLVSTGAVGALAFLALALLWIRQARTTLRAAPAPELVGAAAVAAAEVVFLLFNFDQPAMAAWAWPLAGWLVPAATEPRRAPAVTAGALLAALLALEPVVADAGAAAGLRAEADGDRGGAEAWMGRASRLAPYECFYPLRLAAMLRSRDAAATAAERIAALTPCRELEPENAFVRYHLGLAYADQAARAAGLDEARALVELGRATELAPSVPQFHHALGQALVGRGDAEGGLAEIGDAIGLETDDRLRAGDLNDYGNVLALLGRRSEAAKAYLAATNLDPSQPRARENLARLTPPLAPLPEGEGSGVHSSK